MLPSSVASDREEKTSALRRRPNSVRGSGSSLADSGVAGPTLLACAREARRDARTAPVRVLRHPRHRGRGQRLGHRRGCGPARLSHAAARGQRLRQRHLEPQHQARSRRRALPRAAELLAGDGGAAGARDPLRERAPPRREPGLRRPALPLVGRTVLRGRPQALRCARRQAEPRPQPRPRSRRDPRGDPEHRGRRSHRRDPIPRRPVRRRPHGAHPGPHRRRPRRGGAERHGGDRPHQDGRHYGPDLRCDGARSRDRRDAARARQGRGERDRHLLR